MYIYAICNSILFKNTRRCVILKKEVCVCLSLCCCVSKTTVKKITSTVKKNTPQKQAAHGPETEFQAPMAVLHHDELVPV